MVSGGSVSVSLALLISSIISSISELVIAESLLDSSAREACLDSSSRDSLIDAARTDSCRMDSRMDSSNSYLFLDSFSLSRVSRWFSVSTLSSRELSASVVVGLMVSG